MKKVDINIFKHNKNLVLWFITVNFPEGYSEKDDISCIEYMEENYELDDKEIDSLTQYYEGVFEENDGYVNDPNNIVITLSNKKEYRVAIHPGDIEYFIENEKIGCTGPDYEIRKLDFCEYKKITKDLNEFEKLFVLPMVCVPNEYIEEFQEEIEGIISSVQLEDIDDIVYEFVLSNCKG